MAASGQVGKLQGVFNDSRANIRIVNEVPKLPRNAVRYVAFSNIDHLTFDPDVFILVCPVDKAEIVLRAVSYKTGTPWNNRSSVVLSCSWFYIYPYLTGEVNYMVTGLDNGMYWRNVPPPGNILISIPYNVLSEVSQNLREMDWVLRSHSMDAEAYMKWNIEEMGKLAGK